MDAINEHWKNVFSYSKIGTIGFKKNLKEYLSSGLGLEELCGFVNLTEDGEPQYAEFLRAVMDSKIHVKEKNTKDCLDIDPETEQPYSIWSLFAGFVFATAHNPKVDRYIPIEEIREALKKGIGKEYDVDQYIDQYLKEEANVPEIDMSEENLSEDGLEKMINADSAEVLQQFMDKEIEKLQNQHDKYDIVDFEDLTEYKRDCTIEPTLIKALKRFFQFYHGALEEQGYKDLMDRTPEERIVFLIERNRYIMLRDIDWRYIFSEIEDNPDTYERYYPMVRVKCNSNELVQMVRAFVLNDELYVFVKE